MDFIPHSEETIHQMLTTIGIKTLDDLYKDINPEMLIKRLNLPDGLSEPDVLRKMTEIANKNGQYKGYFMGAGCYYHYIPTLIDFVISRSEFYTAYTPYQAEVSQGYLQAIYEYQTAITRLTGMDVANASMYDGATALAEAAILAVNHTGKNQIVIIKGIHPQYIDVVKTYCWGRSISIKEVSLKELPNALTEEVAGILFQSPNFFGEILDVKEIVSKVRTTTPDALIVQTMSDITCLGVIQPPGELDIDVFVAEGQPLGIAPSFGGPGLGIFTAKQKLVRKIPGRLIGKTKELTGDREGFVLTLQAREQHIRREKAFSNICSNQALCMLASLVYMVSLGKAGLYEVASQNFRKAAYLKQQLKAIPGLKLLSSEPSYNEFVLKVPDAEVFIKKCEKVELLPPLHLVRFFPEKKNEFLVCVTESNTKEQLENFIKVAKEVATK
jgi:glycine dehydrogenase subunit 1